MQMSAWQGNAESKDAIGKIYRLGACGIDETLHLARKWFYRTMCLGRVLAHSSILVGCMHQTMECYGVLVLQSSYVNMLYSMGTRA